MQRLKELLYAIEDQNNNNAERTDVVDKRRPGERIDSEERLDAMEVQEYTGMY